MADDKGLVLLGIMHLSLASLGIDPRDFVFKIKQKPTKAPGYGAEMHDKCPSPQGIRSQNTLYL